MSELDRFMYDAGASGNVTVPSGRYVRGVLCHAAAATSNATLTITPQGEDTAAGLAGPPIPIPGGTAISFGVPVLDPDLGVLDNIAALNAYASSTYGFAAN
jgi:hypothetical protein